VKARELVERFQRMLRSGKDEELEGWIDEATASPLASFAKGICVDRKAVAAAIVEPCSKGQTEVQITRLNLVNGTCTAAPSSTCCEPACPPHHRRRAHLLAGHAMG
jgi:transposase